MSNGTKWLDNAVFYEIYPQSFYDTDGDGIGNIAGITEKLDYIKELGCTAIWINPCFDSPFGDAGYDISDYYRVAPRYGTNEDLVSLFESAHKAGMHVILDLVPGHTSWKHPWFKESMKAERNAYTDRYIWTDSVNKMPGGRGALCGISERDGCCLVNYYTHQPALNYGYYKVEESWQQSMDAPGPVATREEMKNVMRFWLSKGCDGFRVDMAGTLVKGDPERKGSIALWQDMRAFLDAEFPSAVIVSEWGDPSQSLEGGFHMDFLLHFGPSHYIELFRTEHPYFAGTGDASLFAEKYKEYYEQTAGRGYICIPSGNHDMSRLARRVKGENKKLAFAFLLSMPGVPYIYYGDEIGMNYVENIPSVEGGYTRTGARSPMQWNKDKNAGFSTAEKEKLYVPLDPDPNRPTAEEQMSDPASLRSEVKRLIEIRQAHPALQSAGKIEFISNGEKGRPLAYLRSYENERVFVAVNPCEKAAEIPLPGVPGRVIYACGEHALPGGKTCVIGARSAVFITIE